MEKVSLESERPDGMVDCAGKVSHNRTIIFSQCPNIKGRHLISWTNVFIHRLTEFGKQRQLLLYR